MQHKDGEFSVWLLYTGKFYFSSSYIFEILGKAPETKVVITNSLNSLAANP